MLDMGIYEALMMVFHKRKAADEIRYQNSLWMAADIND